MRADDSFAEGVCRLLHLGLYGAAWVGQEHSRASAPSQEGISAISAASVTNEGGSSGGSQERGGENARSRIHQAMQVWQNQPELHRLKYASPLLWLQRASNGIIPWPVR
jgi:hypothetical protein